MRCAPAAATTCGQVGRTSPTRGGAWRPNGAAPAQPSAPSAVEHLDVERSVRPALNAQRPGVPALRRQLELERTRRLDAERPPCGEQLGVPSGRGLDRRDYVALAKGLHEV